jgi:pimeloyl-ACP methyl ester carboxylesterase
MSTPTLSPTRLAYDVAGTGEPVLLLPPAGTRAAVWQTHQVPALVHAGYQVLSVDGRGTPPSIVPPGPYQLADMVADTAELIEQLDLAPCRIVGASLGAMAAQELCLARPELVRAAALLGTRCRTSSFQRAVAAVRAAELREPGGTMPPDTAAVLSMSQLFSPSTLADDRQADDWYTLLRTFPPRGAGLAAQYDATVIPDRRAALRLVDRPCLVIAFADDLLAPPSMAREVAFAIPGCRYIQLPNCGHLGFLERPAAVNAALTGFFASLAG